MLPPLLSGEGIEAVVVGTMRSGMACKSWSSSSGETEGSRSMTTVARKAVTMSSSRGESPGRVSLSKDEALESGISLSQGKNDFELVKKCDLGGRTSEILKLVAVVTNSCLQELPRIPLTLPPSQTQELHGKLSRSHACLMIAGGRQR